MLLEADSVDQAFVTSGGERGELVVETRPGRRAVHEPKVDRGQSVDAERS